MAKHHVKYRDGNAAFKAAFDAAFPGLPQCMTIEEAERRMTAALIAYDGVRWTERAEYEHRQRVAKRTAAVGRLFAEKLRPEVEGSGRAAFAAGKALRRAAVGNRT